ncbi:hypothetical protein ACHAPU_008085 [Fusarium lateritium]
MANLAYDGQKPLRDKAYKTLHLAEAGHQTAVVHLAQLNGGERRSSIIFNNATRELYNRLEEVEEHYSSVTIPDPNLAAQIKQAESAEDNTKLSVAAAKAHITVV